MRWELVGPDITQWHTWFAWRPVKGPRKPKIIGVVHEQWMWLEIVERRLVQEHMGSYWEYRPKSK
jgi:hypothetical protein